MQRREFIRLTSLAAISHLPISSWAFASESKWHSYQKSIILDGLSYAFDLEPENLKNKTVDKKKLAVIRSSGITAINFTIPYPGDDYKKTNEKVLAAKSIIKKYDKVFCLVTKTDDILTAKKEGQTGIIMGFQSTEMFDEKLLKIAEFAKLGVRVMQVTYNRASRFGDGCLEKSNRGLTPLGRKAISVMEENRVLVDLSHAGQQTTKEAIQYAKRPLTISHTGCNAIYKHPRNNDDAELKTLANKGGVVGIYLMPFLEGGDNEIKGAMVIRHIEHALKICGEDHVAIGSDQSIVPVDDGPEYREMIRKDVERRIKAGISAPGETPKRPPFIAELNSERRMEMIAFRLSRKGYNDRIIEKVIGMNLFNLYRKVW